MKIWRNLFGKGDKIHASEIAINSNELLSELVEGRVIEDIGSNSDGYYVKYPDGTVFWSRYFNAGLGVTNGAAEVSLPVNLVGNTSRLREYPCFVSGGIEFNTGGAVTNYKYFSHNCMVINSNTVRVGFSVNEYVGADRYIRFFLFGYGRWK